MLRRACVPVLAAVLGCASARAPRPEEATPGVVVPLHFAEGDGDGALAEPVPSGVPAASDAPSASSSAAPVAPPRQFTSDPPDPTPLRLADQYEYTLHYEDEKIRLVALRHVRFPKPVVTARRMGRYAVELWIGHELVDRVRFDFPMLAASEPTDKKRHKIYETPALTGGPYTVTVLVPAAPRARQARLVDRATRLQAKLSWPPSPSGELEITPMDPPSTVPPAAPASPAPSVSVAVAPPPASSANPATPSSALPSPVSPPSAPPGAPPPATSKPPASRLPPEPPARPRPPPPRELDGKP